MTPDTRSIKLTLFESAAIRFTIKGDPEEGQNSALDIEEGFVCLPLECNTDSEGLVRAAQEDLYFIYSPPTGIFKLGDDIGELIGGSIIPLPNSAPVMRVRLHPGDRVYGFGSSLNSDQPEHQTFYLCNSAHPGFDPDRASSSFPFFIIKRGQEFRGVFLNSVLPMETDINYSEKHPDGPHVSLAPAVPNFEQGRLDVFFFYGDLPEIFRAYAAITGKPFLPPAWALGFHQSRESTNQQKVLQHAQETRQAEIPCDAIHLDINTMDDHRAFTWHPIRFSSPGEMNGILRRQGLRSVVLVEPGILREEGYKTYEQGKKGGYFCKTDDGFNDYVGKGPGGSLHFPDFSSRQTCNWWSENHRDIFKTGISGVLLEGAEPVLKTGKYYDPFQEDINHETGEHPKVRNLYANLMAGATWRSFHKFRAGERPFILSSAGHCGIQKYAALWTDANNYPARPGWRGLQENLFRLLNLGMSGTPFIGADVDFSGGKGYSMLRINKERELYIRRLELGSLSPLFRTQPVFLSQTAHETNEEFELCRKHIRRRYRLLPYIYKLMFRSNRSGEPVLRPLFYDFPEMEQEVEDQFMLGAGLMAAPVLKQGARTRRVYLPPGLWYEYESGKKYEGDSYQEIPVSPGFYPLFVRGGTVLPAGRVGINSESSLAGPLQLEIYPGEGELQGELILDDFFSDQALAGNYYHLGIQGETRHRGDLTLELKTLHKGFNPPQSEIELRLPGTYPHMTLANSPSREKIDGQKISLLDEDRDQEMYSYPCALGDIRLEFPYKTSWEFQ